MMEKESDGEDKRRHPRLYLDLPIEYRFTDLPSAHGGIVVNGSETGFLIYSLKDIPIGTKLNITVLFPKGFQLANFEVWPRSFGKISSRKKTGKGISTDCILLRSMRRTVRN